MHTIAVLPFEIGDIVSHPTLDWAEGLRIIGLTLGADGMWTANVTEIEGAGFWQFPAHELQQRVLSNGTEVFAGPEDRSPEMARRLGYGSDVDAMTRDHDPLHARLTDWLGMPFSYSLMEAAGCDVDPKLAILEEAAVLAVQEFKARWDRR